jgi:imidazolonepropionase-like amidohydrolase
MKHLLLLLSLMFTTCAIAQQTGSSSAQVTVIRAGTLIDGKHDKPRRDQVIVIRGNRIESVADAANAKIPVGATVIDLSKQTVLPGLIDSHTHIFLQGEDPAQGGYDANILTAPLAMRAARATVAARRALEQGFTTLRDVETEGAGYGDVGIKQAIEAGYIPRPRLLVVTRAISTTGDIRWKGTRRNWRCRKAHRSSTDLWKRARPHANNWTMAPTGSRCI